ncbi:MAG: NAD-dependent protein deacylase [Acidobacteriota bacterium]|nr:NAD-dependent protein deacylase [Acidobacteriota bacterium]
MALSSEVREVLAGVAERMHGCRSILFITGAGISADSNLPTYRGVGGLYNDTDAEEGIPIEEALSGNMLTRRPDIAWRHISRIEKACRNAVFNRGHEVIALLEKKFERVWVLTQNVDGFHREAGSNNVIDIHGDLRKLACTMCPWREVVQSYANLTDIPPDCPECHSLVRPEVVLFGEMLPMDKLAVLYQQSELGFDMVFSVGTSSLFPYIVEPVVAAKRYGIPTVEINPGQTDLSRMVDFRVKAGAADSLDYLWSLISG